jgi:hypothetical protein
MIDAAYVCVLPFALFKTVCAAIAFGGFGSTKPGMVKGQCRGCRFGSA